MPRLSQAQQAARAEIGRLAGTTLSPAELSQRLLAVLDRVVPSDGQQLFGVDPSTLLFNRVLAVSPDMARHTLWYLRSHYLSEPLADLDHPALLRARYPALVLHERLEVSWDAPAHLVQAIAPRDWQRIYRERQGPAGGVLRAYFATDGLPVAGLVLARFDAAWPFRPGDVAFVRQVAPMVGRALRGAFERERALATSSLTRSATGVLVLAPDGREQLATPVAEAWLRTLGETEARLGTSLPAVVWSVLAALRAGSGASVAPVARLDTPAGRLRVEASSGQDGSLAIVLAPEQPPPAPAVPGEWPLTTQERQVVSLTLRGLTTREIAATLIVSEHTVETHLGHVYGKLEVHSRSQLLARLFRESFWPRLADTGQ